MAEPNQDRIQDEEAQVLCVSNSYVRKFYMDPQFARLPEQVQQELKILCVSFTEDVGGVLELFFDETNALRAKTIVEDGDYLFDEIGAELKLKEMGKKHAELFSQLELYYRVLIKGENEAS